MPPRIPGQPESVISRYRERLNEEMATQGETDRSLAEKLREAGFPVPYSSINKTRNGTRQPTLDECYAVARALGYPDLERFLEGPASIRINRAVNQLQQSFEYLGLQLRMEVQQAIHNLHQAVNDPEAAAAMASKNPQWREEFRDGLAFDLRYIIKDQTALWGETSQRLDEVFNGVPAPPDRETVRRWAESKARDEDLADAEHYERQAEREDSRGETDKAEQHRARAQQLRGGADAEA